MKYFWQIIVHKWYVFLACYSVGDISLWRSIIHDWSKFLPAEFIAYRKKYQLSNCSDEEFKLAKLHHIHYNPHHWEYWVLDDEPLPMPEIFIREMMADIIGVEKSYGGEMMSVASYLNKAYPKMILHDDTKKYLKKVLDELGYRLPPI